MNISTILISVLLLGYYEGTFGKLLTKASKGR